MNKLIGWTCIASVAMLGGVRTFAAETLHEDFGAAGALIGIGSRHWPAKSLVGENRGSVFFTATFAEGASPKNVHRSIMTLRTNSRLRLGFSCSDDNRHLVCMFTDNASEHTWRFALPETPFGAALRLGVTWDGTVVRCYVNGRCLASGVQPMAVANVDQLHLGPYGDGWMTGGAWADDVTVHSITVHDEALSPEDVAAASGVRLGSLAEVSPMALVIPAVPVGVSPPKIDGRADSPAWAFAASMPQLIVGNHPGQSGLMPEHGFGLLHDSENIYLSFKSRFPGNVPIIEGDERTAGGREPSLWGTESFEFRFIVEGQSYCFGGNVAGGSSEGRNEDFTWNAPWIYRTSRAMNIDDTVLWRGEIAIPWRSLGLAAPPKELEFNFCRSWKLPKIGAHSSLNLAGGGYTDQTKYVKAKLEPVAATYLLLERSNPAEGHYRERFSLRSSSKASVTYSIALASIDGHLAPMNGVARTYELRPGERIEDEMMMPTGIPGYDALVHTLVSNGRVVMREIVPYDLDERFFSVQPYLLHEKIKVETKSVLLRLKFGPDFRGRIVMSAPGGENVGEWPLHGETLEVPFSLKNAAGEYLLSLVDARNGKKVDSNVVKFPGVGEWARQDFHPERIIPPFKPLTSKVELGRCDEIHTTFSERSYGWKNSLFLSDVVSRGCELLSSPVEVLVDGAPIVAKTFKVGMNKSHRMEFSGTAENVKMTGWLEYDGVNFNRLKVTAPGKSLAIRFSMPSCYARFFHAARGGAWGLKMTDCVRPGRTSIAYYPVLWISDQEKGFCFFTESRRGWNADLKGCFTIEKSEKDTVVTVSVMDHIPENGFEFEFGLQATPMRPLDRNHPFETFGNTYGIELNRPGRRPVVSAALMTMEGLGPDTDTAGFFADLGDEDSRRKLAAREKMFAVCARHPETSPFPYACARWMSVRYPEVAAYLNEWKLVPDLSLDNEGTGHFMYDLCPTTLASDFYLWHFRQLLKKNPLQRGIYCDFGTVKECSNVDHGCEGAIPLLAYREYVRRLAVVQTDFYDDPPIVVLHNTDCNQIPCLSFATHLLNGEHIRQGSSAMLHNKRDILDNYGLDMLACELGTLPLGVSNGPYFPFDRLSEKNGGDEEDAPYKFRMEKAAFAGTLVHGHFPSMHRGHFGLYDKVYRVYEEFGVARDAEFVGYWKDPAVVTGGTNVYVSCYTDGRRVLAVIGHIGKEHEDKDVEIAFDPSVLRLTGLLRTAVDKMTAPDPEYDWLRRQMKEKNVPIWRCPIWLGEFGTRVDGFDGKTLRYHLPYHTYGLVELAP